MVTTYQICLDTETPGEEDFSVVRDTHVLTFSDKESADRALPLLRIAIQQGARCGKVRVSPLDLDEEEAQRRDAIWSGLDLPDYIWLTGVKWYHKVTTEDLL